MGILKKVFFTTIGLAASVSEKILSGLEKTLEEEKIDKFAEKTYQKTKKISEEKINALIKEIEEIREELAENPKLEKLRQRMRSLEEKLKELSRE